MKVAGLTTAAVLLGAAALIAGLQASPALANSFGSARADVRSDGPGDPVKGKQVYLKSIPACSLCHMIGASGGKFGPELTAIGKKRDAAWLAKYLSNPKFENPANKMPAVAAKGKDLEDLIAYLVSLKGK
jgi:cytochrome c2